MYDIPHLTNSVTVPAISRDRLSEFYVSDRSGQDVVRTPSERRRTIRPDESCQDRAWYARAICRATDSI